VSNASVGTEHPFKSLWKFPKGAGRAPTSTNAAQTLSIILLGNARTILVLLSTSS
jgi:hypothetical protein